MFNDAKSPARPNVYAILHCKRNAVSASQVDIVSVFSSRNGIQQKTIQETETNIKRGETENTFFV